MGDGWTGPSGPQLPRQQQGLVPPADGIQKGVLGWKMGDGWTAPSGPQLHLQQQGLVPPADGIRKGALGLSLRVCGTP